MSGGHFNYSQYTMGNIADEIEDVIGSNSHILSKYKFGDAIGYDFSQRTIEKFQEAIGVLRIAAIMVHRIDWLLSCDEVNG